MARALTPGAFRLLAATVAAASVLASWDLSWRLEHEALVVARSYDLAEAVGRAADAVQASVVRARLGVPALATCCTGQAGGVRDAAGVDGSAGSVARPDPAPSETDVAGRSGADDGEAAARSGQAGDLGDYWRAEADAIRQLDTLHTLSLEPGLEWLARQLVELRDASLRQMATMDDALRHTALGAGTVSRVRDRAGTQGGVPHGALAVIAGPGGEPGTYEDKVSLLAGQVRGEADRHRRDVVATSLAQAALDRRRLAAAAVIGAVLPSVLMLATRQRRSVMQPSAANPAPMSRSALPGVTGHPAAGAALGTMPPTSPAQATRGLRVLVVEDNAIVRFSLEAMLSDLGHTVSSAADAAEAMRLATLEPDVLVTDLGLPDLDGLTLASQLREQRPRLRVVIASGRPGSAPGMVWLQKPFDLDRLRRAIKESEALAA